VSAAVTERPGGLRNSAVAAARPAIVVDLGAVAANTRTLAGCTGAEVMAVVKADGFGHGAVDVARTALAHGATWLGVTTVAEAVALRDARVDAPLLSWLGAVGEDHAAAVARSVDLAVPSAAHLAAIVARAPGARVHLHLDTGLARDGADPATWVALCRAARRAERRGLLTVVGVMGHLACADQPSHPANREGRERFAWGVGVARRCGLRPRHRHLAATAATLTDPRSHHTMVRVGAGLVGIDPAGSRALRGALTLTAPLVSVRDVAAGTPVGYGHTWATPAPTRLGLVPLGYADGLPRVASGRAEVLVGGVRRPLVGRISMDQAVVDLGEHPADLGEVVTVLGPGDAGEPTAHDWARWSDTLPHEVLTGLGTRTPRRVRPVVRGLR
jgi:alanine racemase